MSQWNKYLLKVTLVYNCLYIHNIFYKSCKLLLVILWNVKILLQMYKIYFLFIIYNDKNI